MSKRISKYTREWVLANFHAQIVAFFVRFKQCEILAGELQVRGVALRTQSKLLFK
jgi:hypothetical protein